MKEFGKGFKFILVLMIITGIIFPLFMTGISRIIFPEKSKGSIVTQNGKIIGSKLIGQKFTDNKWFIGRPSASDYDGLKSGGSNLALTNPKFKESVNKNIEEFLSKNPEVSKNDIPVDMVTSSASGLDPDISYEAALLQAKRVAKENNISYNEVLKIVKDNKEGKFLGIFGEDKVNVLKVNLALLEKTK